MPKHSAALEIRNLSKTYREGTVALRGIDLDVEDGEFFGLLGPNGAGKSTTIGIVTSLVNKSGGTVKCFGIDLDHIIQLPHVHALACLHLQAHLGHFELFLPIHLASALALGRVSLAVCAGYLTGIDGVRKWSNHTAFAIFW